MACKIINNSGLEISGFEDMIQSLVSFSQDRFGFEKPPTLFLNSDPANAENMLGKTAYYDPERKEIHIFTTDRHPKDIMRSISHELVHHNQNHKGEFGGDHYSGEGYAQKDPHMRKMEQEAYLQGNMCFRDWEDGYKQKQKVYKEWRTNTMSLKEWKNKELFGLLSNKWGFGKNIINEEAKPDFLDLDKDGDKKEPMKDAAKDAKEKDDGEKEEEKDLSKVPPQLRKHVAKKKLDEEEIQENDSVLSEATLKDHMKAVMDSEEYRNLPRGSEVKELLNMFLQLKAVSDPDPNVADFVGFMRLLKKRGDDSSERAKAIVNKYNPDRMDEEIELQVGTPGGESGATMGDISETALQEIKRRFSKLIK